MSVHHRSSEKRRIYHEFRRQEEEVIGSLCRLGSRPISPKTQLEQEKRIRREIANSNERRRMQSINAGFQSLRALLPHHEGEKLSKAAILQHTSEFIYQLEQDKTRLLSQNCQLKRLLNNQFSQDSDGSSLDSPIPKRKKSEPVSIVEPAKSWKTQTAESSDEGIGNMSPSSKERSVDDLRREIRELRGQLDIERRLRMLSEDEHRGVEVMYNEKVREIPQHISYHYQGDDDEAFIEEDKPEPEQLSEDDIKIPISPSPQQNESVIEEEPTDGTEIIISTIEECPEDLSSGKPTTVLVQPPVHESLENETIQNESFEDSTSLNNGTVLHILTPTPTTFDEDIDEDDEEENTHHHHHHQQHHHHHQQQQLEENNVENENVEEVLMAVPEGVDFYQLATDQQEPLTRIYPSTSRQNLETIVEAIRHLEGDHMFCDDPEPTVGPCIEVTSTPLEEEHIISNNNCNGDINVNGGGSGGMDINHRPLMAIPKGGHEYAIRQQVIHCSSSNSMRPGVIVVANHT